MKWHYTYFLGIPFAVAIGYTMMYNFLKTRVVPSFWAFVGALYIAIGTGATVAFLSHLGVK